MPSNVKPVIEAVKKRLSRMYRGRFEGIVLYGSYARGDYAPGSDIDLIVLLKRMTNAVEEMEKISKEVHKIDFKYNTLVSVIPFDVDVYQAAKLPILLNARKEGILV